MLSKRWCAPALGYFTERLDPETTRQALLSVVRRAKRNKAFDDCHSIGMAIDGTGAGWHTKHGCSLCRPQRSAQKQIIGYQHSFVLISVVGTGLSLPFDVEPYGPGDSEYAAGQRILRRVISGLGKRFAQYAVVDGKFATAPFLHAVGDLGLRVVARRNYSPQLGSAFLADLPPPSFPTSKIARRSGRPATGGAFEQHAQSLRGYPRVPRFPFLRCFPGWYTGDEK